MSIQEIRFCVADLEVSLRAPDGLDGLSSRYRAYPSRGRAADLEIEAEIVPGFARGRERGPEYPGFSRRLRAPRTIALERFDAAGEVVLPERAGPVRARFRMGESRNSLEAAVRIGMSVAMPRRGGLLVHASAICARGAASIFAGVSGAGKSTIAALITGASPAFTRLSDELLIVRLVDGGVLACAAPFLGSDGAPHGASAPLAAIHFLEQAPSHQRTRLGQAEAVRELLRHVLVYVAEADTAAHVLGVAARVVAAAPCHRLRFARDPGVVEVLDIG